MKSSSTEGNMETSYAENYAILKGIAEKLRNAGPANIDTLIEDFRRARTAYGFCRERLDAIRDEIEAEIDRTPGDLGEDPFAA
jgi:exonuclease VII small subunit